VADAALAALVTAVGVGGSLTIHSMHGTQESQPLPFGIALLVVGGAALLARRRYPGAVLGVVLVTTLAAQALGAIGAARADRRLLQRRAAREALGGDRTGPRPARGDRLRGRACPARLGRERVTATAHYRGR
jgi:uncharacterized protein (TIGR03382 family)